MDTKSITDLDFAAAEARILAHAAIVGDLDPTRVEKPRSPTRFAEAYSVPYLPVPRRHTLADRIRSLREAGLVR